MIPVIAFVIGASLGLFYFGGLWLTVQQLPVTQHPYRLIFFSFIFRLGVTLFILSLIISGNRVYSLIISGNRVYGLIPLLTCCLGFLLIRTLMILLIQPRHKITS